MHTPKIIRHKNTLCQNKKSKDTQQILSLLNFVEYKQTFFPINNDKGNFLIPANTIETIIQNVNGSTVHCQNNQIFHSSHSIDFWKKSLDRFDRFVEDNRWLSTKIITLYKSS